MKREEKPEVVVAVLLGKIIKNRYFKLPGEHSACIPRAVRSRQFVSGQFVYFKDHRHKDALSDSGARCTSMRHTLA